MEFFKIKNQIRLWTKTNYCQIFSKSFYSFSKIKKYFRKNKWIEKIKSKSTPNSLNNNKYDSSNEEYEIEINNINVNTRNFRKKMMILKKNSNDG